MFFQSQIDTQRPERAFSHHHPLLPVVISFSFSSPTVFLRPLLGSLPSFASFFSRLALLLNVNRGALLANGSGTPAGRRRATAGGGVTDALSVGG